MPKEIILLFADYLDHVRQEHGLPIEDIAKCFRYQFDEAELSSLIVELQKGKL
jgi:hypothetical protein